MTDIKPTDELLENGWFVNSHGDVYAIVNGSLYAVDVSDRPAMQGLAFGSYTNEQMDEIVSGESSGST